MPIGAIITLTTAGINSGPFNLYSNVDGYTTPFETNVTRASLLAGYTSYLVPTGTTNIFIENVSTNTFCSDYDLNIVATVNPLVWAFSCPRTVNLTKNVAASVQVNYFTTGGIPPYTYYFVGVLPAGLSWNTSTATLTGTPTVSGTYSGRFINATDSSGLVSGTCSVTIIVT